MKLDTLKEILEALRHDNGMCYKDVNVNMAIENDEIVYKNEFTVNFILDTKRINMFAKQHHVRPKDFGSGGPRFAAHIKLKDNMYLDKVYVSIYEEDIKILTDYAAIKEFEAKKILDSIIAILEYEIFITLKED